MKKIFLLVIVSFLLCGCTANVNINISNDKIEEEVVINAPVENGLTKEQTHNQFRKFIPIYADTIVADTEPDEQVTGVKYYNRTEQTYNNGYIFNYRYTFSLNDYLNSQTLKNAFQSYSIITDNSKETIELSTDNGGMLFFNNYPSLSEVKVNISTDYKVLEHNADSVNNNTYTWNFTTTTRKSIHLKLDNHKEQQEPSNPSENPSTSPSSKEKSEFSKFLNKHPVLVAVCAIAIFLIFVIIISKLSKR